jgi:hypothetical protein
MTTTVNLRTEADAEARRLTAARALAPDNVDRAGPPGVNGPWIARARGARRRSPLAGRTLLIWEIGCGDATGRMLANAVVAMLVRLTPWPSGRAVRSSIADFAGAIESCLPGAIVSVLEPRQRELVEACSAHARMRLAREHAIAASRSTGAAPSYQAGLFDRRTERAQRLRAAEAEDLDRLTRARVLAASSAATISLFRPRLLLVLTA